jgi:hypothetical protein
VLLTGALAQARSLVVVPSNVLLNWEEEFMKWIPRTQPGTQPFSSLVPERVAVFQKSNSASWRLLDKWAEVGGSVLIITHDM